MKNLTSPVLVLILSLASALTASAQSFEQELGEGKILATMKITCGETLASQKQLAQIIHSQVSLSDTDLMALVQQNPEQDLTQAIGQLEFVSSELMKEMTQVSATLEKNRISIDQFCIQVDEAQKSVQALQKDFIGLKLRDIKN